MCGSSAIYAVNTFSTDVLANEIVPLTSVIRKFGSACSLSNYGVRITQPGYYEVEANVTISPTAAGDMTLSLYKDGIKIPGATATVQTAVVSQDVTVTIPAIIRQTCCAQSGIITIVASSAGNVTNAAMVVKRI